ncbi:MAG: hypothetical protein ACT4PY_05945 [Armatimonadota bacterium]
MGRKVQVVLDDSSYRLLKELASPRAGNQSFVVREAIRYFAEREKVERALDAVLAQPHARKAMDAGIAAWREGRLRSHHEVVRRLRRRKAKR